MMKERSLVIAPFFVWLDGNAVLNCPEILMVSPHYATPACLRCGSTVFTGADLDSLKIKPDDVTVCLYCGAVLIFNEDLSFRQASEEDLQKLQNDKDTWDLIRKLTALVSLRNQNRTPS